MDGKKYQSTFTFLLATLGGFCDAITFFSPAKLFSAHVTGNFIVFAYDLVGKANDASWIKLISLPVFVLAIIAAAYSTDKIQDKYFLLKIEGVILVLAGLVAWLLSKSNLTYSWSIYIAPMLVVFAMGIQNIFNRKYIQKAYGPTTMMTGNVTQASLDLLYNLKNKFNDPLKRLSFGHECLLLSGFLLGCTIAAWTANWMGLAGVALMGIILLLVPKPKDYPIS